MPKTIDVSKLKLNFGENNELKDEYLFDLLGKAYKGEILCRSAVIKMDAIQPFSDYKPKVSGELRLFFDKKMEQGEPVQLCVYQKDGKFIMSDDYNAYSLYLEKGVENIPCVIIGEIIDSTNVVTLGPPFQLEEPKIEIINEN